MRNNEDRNKYIKGQARQEIVVLLEEWKSRRKKHKIYRNSLIGALVVSSLALCSVGYYYLDSNIPSTIYVRADDEQSFNLGVPATANIVSVSGQGGSNIPKGAVTINLNQPVNMRTGGLEQYQMEVKLFGFLPFKQVGIQVVEEKALIPVGEPVGIYVKTDGILVIGDGEFLNENGTKCTPSRYVLKSGDYIQKLNGESVSDKDDFIERIKSCDGKEIVLTVERNGQAMDVKIQPIKDQNGEYKIGAWVRDNAQGVGTMTYMDGEGNFGALGHGISDIDTSTLMDMNDGTLYETRIVDIKKGSSGTPGEMTGLIVYSDDKILGDITDNSDCGIFGQCNEKARKLATKKALPIAFKQEIVKGPAQILCTVEDDVKYYDIEITALHLDHDNINRGIELRVTDPALIGATGGIVQGMFTSYNGSNNRKARKIKGFLMF